MRFVIITGMSGAGKSLVVRQMEDLEFFCIDNMPPLLMPKFFELIQRGEAKIDKVALVVDIRGGELFNHLGKALQDIKKIGISIEIVFLEAGDDALIKRFKETRRTHPLSKDATILRGIHQERQILENIKHDAQVCIDTSNLSPKQLKEKIADIFSDTSEDRLAITILSFGFKYGIPRDSDLVFDVRFIPNPFYIDEMRQLTGKDEKVANFVLEKPETVIFMEKTIEMLDYFIPYYVREGKSQLIVSIGCTGGMHRSVSIAERIYEELNRKNARVTVEHRDLDRDNRGVY